MPIKVLIVDDSAVVRQVVQDVLSSEADIQVMGVASDPIFALEKMKKEWPDVIVLDIEMPRMDGLTFLRQIMGTHPTPVVICSSLAEKGAAISVEALSAGAVSIITKPNIGVRDFLRDASDDLIMAVRAASRARVGSRVSKSNAVVDMMNERHATPKLSADVIMDAPKNIGSLARTTEQIVALGTSTGGTQALEQVLPALPANCPGLVIVQHMPEKFTAAFANRLNSLSQIEVKEAQNGDRVLTGRALIAPGGKHMLLKRSGAQYHVEVIDGPLVSRHRPSVDVLFRSVAKFAGANAMGFLMTGMGDDGAKGLKEMHDCGARTYAQDEASCVVYGMPKEAVKLGAVDEIIALQRIPDYIVRR
jgi:two-component system, chemotaxis family, protein-glutamate methylesterase/glutaminase